MVSELRTELEEIYKDFFAICEFSDDKNVLNDLLSRIEYLNEEITKIEFLDLFHANPGPDDDDLDPAVLNDLFLALELIDDELIEDEEVDWAKEGF